MNAIIGRRLGSGGEAEDRPHRHDYGQFVLVRRGILHGHAERNTWVLQAGMAAWIPADFEHWGRASNSVELAVLYLSADQCQNFPQTARPLLATPLMIALCERLIAGRNGDLTPERSLRMMEMLLEEIAEAPPVGLILPLPQDPRLRRLTNALMTNPSNRLSLAEWGRQVGATERTLMRLFRRETGLRFSEWYDRLLLSEAVRSLADGLGNERLAENLGFASGDSFGHWFRRVTGISPSNFAENLNQNSERLELFVSFDNLSGSILRSEPGHA
jgi:AraC-like DNA-binding protein